MRHIGCLIVVRFHISTTPTYRFRVHRAATDCSQDWRVWIEGSEVYLAPRSVGHQYKASFHSSGQCQVGLSSSLRESLIGDPLWEGKSRLFSVWNVPTTFSRNERVILVELFFPGSYLDNVTSKPGKSVELLECPDNHVVSICLLKSSLQSGVSFKSSNSSFRELSRLPCTDGCSLSVLYRVLPENDEYRNYLRYRYWSHYLAEPSSDGLTFGTWGDIPTSADVRALIWDGRTEPKQWHEVSVRKLHALGPPQTDTHGVR